MPLNYVCAQQLCIYCPESQFWNPITAKKRIIDKRRKLRQLGGWGYQAAVIKETYSPSSNVQQSPHYYKKKNLLNYSLRDMAALLTLELIKWNIICPQPAQKAFHCVSFSPEWMPHHRDSAKNMWTDLIWTAVILKTLC